MFSRRHLRLGVATAATLAAACLVGSIAAVAHGHRPIVSHLVLPLTGTVTVDNAGPGCTGTDSVVIQAGSEVHVTAIVKTQGKGTNVIHVDLVDVVGLGQTLTPQQTYLGEGARSFPHQTIQSQVSLTNEFDLTHTSDGCEDSKMLVSLTLDFTGEQLTGGTAVASTPP